MRLGRNLLRGFMLLWLLFNTAALYFSTIHPPPIRDAITILYFLIVVCAMSLLPFRLGMAVAAAASACVLVWYLRGPPRNERNWAAEYAIPVTVAQPSIT